MNAYPKPDLYVYATEKRHGRTLYTRIGAAWANRAGGYGVWLDALPVGREMVLFPPREGGEDDGGAAEGEGA